MILPDKDTRVFNSILGWSAGILSVLNRERTVSSLWEELKTHRRCSYQKFVLALNLLFILGIVELRYGSIRRTRNVS